MKHVSVFFPMPIILRAQLVLKWTHVLLSDAASISSCKLTSLAPRLCVNFQQPMLLKHAFHHPYICSHCKVHWRISELKFLLMFWKNIFRNDVLQKISGDARSVV